ncbi:MAG: hypothetical protein KR126chlam2_01178 [Chlamydiae bacterium]|nr:hypothetical protein [Chlamydiota bacterium]
MPIIPQPDAWDSTAQQVGAHAIYAIASPIVGLLRIGVSGYYLVKHLYYTDLKPKFSKVHREAMEHLKNGTLPGHKKSDGEGLFAKGKQAGKQVVRSVRRTVAQGADQLEAKGYGVGRALTGTDTYAGWKKQFKRGLIELTLIGGIAYAILGIRDNKPPEEFAGVDKVENLLKAEVMWSEGLKAVFGKGTVSSEKSAPNPSSGSQTAAAATQTYRARTAAGVRARNDARNDARKAKKA